MQSYNGSGKTSQSKKQPLKLRHDGEATEADLVLADCELNDAGNGQRLLRRFGQNLLYEPSDQREPWLIWVGDRWLRSSSLARQHAHKTQQGIYAEAAALAAAGDDKGARVLQGWATEAGNSNRLGAMMREAVPYLTVEPQELDGAQNLLPVRNGTLELQQWPGEDGAGPVAEVSLREHRREDRFTKQAAVAFDPDAKCPKFEAFMERVQPAAAKRRFLQRYYGLALTGRTTQHVVLNYGLGANGKSTFNNVVRMVLGDWAVQLNFDSVCDDGGARGSEATPDLCRMVGARLVAASEPRTGAKLSEHTIKSMTGGEPFIARQLFSKAFEFMPTHKLTLTFNNPPHVQASDAGTWRRIVFVSWPESIPESERRDGYDHHLFETEGSGILNWLVEGFMDWAENGLQIPAEIKEETAHYKQDTNPVQRFIDDCVEKTDPALLYDTRAREIVEAYNAWCKFNAVAPLHQTALGRRMTAMGFQKSKAGTIVYRNCRIKDGLPFAVDGANVNVD